MKGITNWQHVKLRSDIPNVLKIKLTIKISGGFQMIKHPVGLPPPMMLYLSEFCFSIMTVQVWPISIQTFHRYCSVIIDLLFENLNEYYF